MENENRKVPMSVVLGSDFIKGLGNNLNLSKEQKQRATSAAIRLSSDEKLRRCDSYSIAKYCFEVARYNFTRDDCVYPVPYNNSIQAQIGYKGYREMALQAGYEEVTCNEVRSCDTILRDRETGTIRIQFCDDYAVASKSNVIGYYAYAKENGRIVNSVYWDLSKIIEHGKHYSRSFNGIWSDKFTQDKMCKKTLIKQLCAELRSTPQLDNALKVDGYVFGNENGKDGYLDNPENERTKGVNNAIDDIEIIDSEEVSDAEENQGQEA